MMYELPPQGRGTAEQQLNELRDYLVRMARDLDRAGTSEVVIQQAANKAVAKQQLKTVEDIRARAEELKSLIIKTAKEVYAEMDEREETYNGLYLAQSSFGTYLQNSELSIKTMATGVVDSYHYEESIASAQTAANNANAAAEAYHTELIGQIRRGIIEDPDTHELHLGVAISENLEFTGAIETHNGQEYYRLAPGQTLGLYTSVGWQFWVNGYLVGYFSSGDSMLHVKNIVADDSVMFGTGWEITTTNGFGLRYVGP